MRNIRVCMYDVQELQLGLGIILKMGVLTGARSSGYSICLVVGRLELVDWTCVVESMVP